MHSTHGRPNYPLVELVRSFSLPIVIALAVQAAPVASRADDPPPRHIAVEGDSLVLNGHGKRELWWTEVYRCALYLPTPSASIDYIADERTSKALQIYILNGNIPDSLPADWRELFREKLSRELFGKLKGAYADLQKNDRLIFAYSPASGTKVIVNEQQILTDPGHGLMEAVLDQWLGERPVSKALRRRLLAEREMGS